MDKLESCPFAPVFRFVAPADYRTAAVVVAAITAAVVAAATAVAASFGAGLEVPIGSPVGFEDRLFAARSAIPVAAVIPELAPGD